MTPVYLASRKIKKGFKEMESRMQQQSFDSGKDPQKGFTTQSSPSQSTSKTKADDYIDYEEIK